MDESKAPEGIRGRFPDLYQELRRVAESELRRRPGHSITPTDLAHDVFLKLDAEEMRKAAAGLLGPAEVSADFKACFAVACRDVLVDRYRRKTRDKRGGGQALESFTRLVTSPADGSDYDILELDDELRDIEQLDPVLAQVIELRVFGDLSNAELAEALGTSERTVIRKWKLAQAELVLRFRRDTA